MPNSGRFVMGTQLYAMKQPKQGSVAGAVAIGAQPTAAGVVADVAQEHLRPLGLLALGLGVGLRSEIIDDREHVFRDRQERFERVSRGRPGPVA